MGRWCSFYTYTTVAALDAIFIMRVAGLHIQIHCSAKNANANVASYAVITIHAFRIRNYGKMSQSR